LSRDGDRRDDRRGDDGGGGGVDPGGELENDGQKRHGCSVHRCVRKVPPHVLPVSIAVLLPTRGHARANDTGCGAADLSAPKEEADPRE